MTKAVDKRYKKAGNSEKIKLNDDDLYGALDDAMVTDARNEVNQAYSKVVFKFDGMTIFEGQLMSVCKDGQWLTDDIKAYTPRYMFMNISGKM